jgi:hypothetical protein
MSPERDYPVGHPAAGDYAKEAYVPPSYARLLDYPPDHPAHHGKNSKAVDSPDGMRDAQNSRGADLKELAAVGSLPPLIDPAKKEPVPVPSSALADIYAARMKADFLHPPTDADRLAVRCIMALGYSMDQAYELYENYTRPAKPAE